MDNPSRYIGKGYFFAVALFTFYVFGVKMQKSEYSTGIL